jgi:hypothetical protein
MPESQPIQPETVSPPSEPAVTRADLERELAALEGRIALIVPTREQVDAALARLLDERLAARVVSIAAEEIHAPPLAVGDVVIYHCRPDERGYNGGKADAAAVVTAVHSPSCVNVRVMLDSTSTLHHTSIEKGLSPGQWRPR